jgi:hypothetical protein
VFATELFGTGNVTEIEPNNAVYTMANVIPAQTVNVAYTLTGATWGTQLVNGSLTYVNNGSGVGRATVALVDGGANTDTTATFRVTVTNATLAGDNFSLDYTLRGATGLGTASTTNGPTLAFSITDTLGNVDTAGTAGVVASSIDAVTTTMAASASTSKIDVANNSTQFTDTASTLSFNAGTFNITDNGAVANGVEDDGSTAFTLNSGNAGLTSTTATLTGDFSASLGVDTDLDSNTSEGEGVTISGCRDLNATTLTADTATFVITGGDTATIGGAATACQVNINVDGTTVIPEMNPSLNLSIVYSGTGYADETRSLALQPIIKDGVTQQVGLLLNPDGAYDNFIRVSNQTSTTGSVFITVYNDAGASATYTLITDLPGNASSDLISVDTIYASAQAANTAFDVGTGKLRASLTGEFGAMDVQNISTSTDGTTFFTF